MGALPFVDAHIHLWDLTRLRYPWLTPPFDDNGPNGSVEAIAKTYLLDDYLADAKAWNVVGAVHVDAGAEGASALDETRWLQAMADERGLPSGLVAFAALDAPDVEALLDALTQRIAPFGGIRHIVNWHADLTRTYTPRDATGDPAWRTGFGLLAKHGLSFDLQCYPGQMLGLVELFARHLDIPVMINHAGMPVDTDDAGKALWRAGMTALAALPQVSVKLSGFGFIYRQWTEDQIRPYILEAIDIFGTDRCMFASDVPTDKLFGSLDKHLSAYDAITAGFSEDERRDLFGRNANRLYRLELDLLMRKIATRMRLKPGQLNEYRRRHDALWPELAELLKASGISDYSIHHDPETNALFAVMWCATPERLDDLPDHPVMRRWWDAMAPLMEVYPDRSPVSVPLDTVFHLA